MNYSRINNINEIQSILESFKIIDLKINGREAKYKFINFIVKSTRYHKLTKKERGVVIEFIQSLTSYKKAQTHRLIKKALENNLKFKVYVRNNPNIKYTAYDIKLLEQTDENHLRLSANATKEILRREFEVFDNDDYENISKVSVSHINNLRKSDTYVTTWVNGTKPKEVKIGETKKPEPNGKPGSIRIDTVHQRNIYHINAVDEVTQ